MSTQEKTQREIDNEILAAGRKRFEHDLRETFGKDVQIETVARALRDYFDELAQARWRELVAYVNNSHHEETNDERNRTLSYIESLVKAIRHDLDRSARARNAE
jgi:hypothetical protein